MNEALDNKLELLAKEYAVKAIFEECSYPFEYAYDSVTAIKSLNDNGKFRKMRKENGLVIRGSEEGVYEQDIAASLIKTKAEIKNLLCYAISLAAPQPQAGARDAERYRWLRDEWLGNEPESINMERAKGQCGLDAAVDAAIAAAKEMK